MLYLDTLCLLSKLYVDFKQREQMLSSLHYHHINVVRSFVCEVSVLGIKDGIRAAAFVRQISHETRSIAVDDVCVVNAWSTREIFFGRI